MSIPATLINLVGNWSGVNRLWLSPDDPMRMSDATADVSVVAQGRFLSIAYTWVEGKPQEGLILLGWQTTSGELQATWLDTWHNGDRMMPCQGHLADDVRVAVQGTYPAPPGPDWGWQIAIEPGDQDSFRIVMDNILPDGMHVLAVEIALTRK